MCLFDFNKALRTDMKESYFEEKLFSADQVTESFQKLLTEQKYKLNILRLQSMCRTTGGRKLAADIVEREYICGHDHLIDLEMLEKTKGPNCCCNLFLYIFLTVSYVTLVLLLYQKYDELYT